MAPFSMSMGALGRKRPRSISNAGVQAAFKDEEEPLFATKPPPTPGSLGGGADSLDAFMEGIGREAARASVGSGESAAKKAKAAWEELQAEDPVVSYFEACEQQEAQRKQKRQGKGEDGDEEAEDGEAAEDAADGEDAHDIGEEDGADRRKKPIEPLVPVDHAAISYEKVRTEFYTPHPQIAKLTPEEVAALQRDLRVTATGSDCPSPVVSFAHLGLPSKIMDGIRRHAYVTPTPIQAQAIPAALSGRDVIGVAETGSGKTVAYLLPLLVHVIDQPELAKDEGPIALVLAPTRELAVQIEKETFKFSKPMMLRSTTLTGGLSKHQQFKEVKGGSEVVIATPGRLIDIIKMKGCTMRRCTFLVLDEADRMMQMGFEYQVRSIVQHVRASRQTLLFSATFPPRIECLANDLLTRPVRITVGKLGQAASSVLQHVEVVATEDSKWQWLADRLDGMLAKGQVLLFTKTRQGAETLAQRIEHDLSHKTLTLHGEVEQDSRMQVMESFRKRQVEILVATDVAARGLDVPAIHTVVSYDAARDIETHTHRVGRTGRAGAEGEAFTLLVGDSTNKRMAALLVGHLKHSGAIASPALVALAEKHPPSRIAKLPGGGPAVPGTGDAVAAPEAADAAGAPATPP